MHPRVDFTRHYTIPRLVDAGFSVLALNSRHPNNDTDTVHEELVLDVAAGADHLRDERRALHVVLLGNSGGGSLMGFFQAQARRAPDERIARTPAGAPTWLPRASLTPADGLVLIAAHRGEGHVLGRSIDPSVVDEHDPSTTDEALDMYAPSNGFLEPPEPSTYDDAFVRRYRSAQLDRVRRLDALARAHLFPAQQARRLARADDFRDRPFAERQAVERIEHTRHVMVVYRTMANLDYADFKLDPSPRGYGSLLSERPDLMNRAFPGFARTITPRAWLSTWSALSSNADLTRTLPEIAEPVLIVHAEKDQEVYPHADFEPMCEAVKSEDRSVAIIDGAGHYFEPPFGQEDAPHVEALMDVVVPWIRARFHS